MQDMPDRDEDRDALAAGVGEEPVSALSAVPRQRFTLRERIRLTHEYHGGWALAYRMVTFPLRLTPLRRYLDRRPSTGRARRVAARRWYRELGRPVTIVIPSYKDAGDVADLVASLRRTTDAAPRARSSSPTTPAAPSTSRRCARSAGSRSSTARPTRASPPTSTAGSRAADPGHDVVVLNSDVIAERGLAGEPAVRGQHSHGRRRDRRRQAPLPRRAHPVRRNGPQPRRARVVRSPLPVPRCRLRARQRRRVRCWR